MLLSALWATEGRPVRQVQTTWFRHKSFFQQNLLFCVYSENHPIHKIPIFLMPQKVYCTSNKSTGFENSLNLRSVISLVWTSLRKIRNSLIVFSSSWRALLSSASDNCLGGGVGAKGKTSKSWSLSNYENNIKQKDKTYAIFRIATGFETEDELVIKYQITILKKLLQSRLNT